MIFNTFNEYRVYRVFEVRLWDYSMLLLSFPKKKKQKARETGNPRRFELNFPHWSKPPPAGAAALAAPGPEGSATSAEPLLEASPRCLPWTIWAWIPQLFDTTAEIQKLYRKNHWFAEVAELLVWATLAHPNFFVEARSFKSMFQPIQTLSKTAQKRPKGRGAPCARKSRTSNLRPAETVTQHILF